MAGRARVYELARELDITSKDVLAMLASFGEFAKSASSVVEAPVANKLRQRWSRMTPRTPRSTPSGPSHSGVRDYRRNDPYQDLGKTGIDHLQTADRPVRRYDDHRSNPLGAATRPRRPGDPPSPQPVARARPRRPRREWWRGAEPAAFVRYILDSLIVPRRDEDAPGPNPPWRYFEDEVKEAQEISAKWSTCMLAGMDNDEILNWRETLDRFPSPAWLLPARDGSPDQAIALRNAGISPSDMGWRYGDEAMGTLPERLARGQLTIDEVILEAKYRRGDTV